MLSSISKIDIIVIKNKVVLNFCNIITKCLHYCTVYTTLFSIILNTGLWVEADEIDSSYLECYKCHSSDKGCNENLTIFHQYIILCPSGIYKCLYEQITNARGKLSTLLLLVDHNNMRRTWDQNTIY